MTGECLGQRQNSDNAGRGTGLVGSLACENEHEREQRDDHRQTPKGLHGLVPGSRECLNQRHSRDRGSEHPEHCGTPDLILCREPRELDFDEVEFVLNAVEVAAD